MTISYNRLPFDSRVSTHVGPRRAIGRRKKSRWMREGGEVGLRSVGGVALLASAVGAK